MKKRTALKGTVELTFCVRKTYIRKEGKILRNVIFFVCQLMPYLLCKKQGKVASKTRNTCGELNPTFV